VRVRRWNAAALTVPLARTASERKRNLGGIGAVELQIVSTINFVARLESICSIW